MTIEDLGSNSIPWCLDGGLRHKKEAEMAMQCKRVYVYIIFSLEPDNEVKLKKKLGRLFGSLPGYLNHQYDTPTPEVELMYQVYLVSMRNVNAFGCLFYLSI